MNSRLDRIYWRSPVWLQNLGVSFYGLFYRRERFGGVFEASVAEFRERDRWPTSRMQEYLEKRLRFVLLHAFQEVPYYSRRWRDLGLRLEDLERMKVSELPKLPVTPKRDLVGKENSFVAQDIARHTRLHRYHSSGSTGTPITCVLSS